MVRLVVFVVLMLFWLFAGGYTAYQGPAFNPVNFGGTTLVPWSCVAILGWVIFDRSYRAPGPP